MHGARREIIGRPGVYHDGGPTGSGKSSADIKLLADLRSSLTILPSHKQCKQAEIDMHRAGLNAAAYAEASKETCLKFDEFKAVVACGLSPSSAICPRCPHNDECEYQEAARQAKNAEHCIATQSRAEHTIETMAKGRDFLSIHDGINCLRPIYEAHDGFESVIAVADEAKRFKSLEDPDYEFFTRLAINAQYCNDLGANATADEVLQLPPWTSPSAVAQAVAWSSIGQLQREVSPSAMRQCWLATSGKLETIMVRVDHPMKPGVVTEKVVTIVGVRRVELPPDSVTLISDGHKSTNEIAHAIGRPVHSITPAGHLHRFWPTYQVPIDIGIGAKRETFIPVLERVLDLLPPHWRRIGLIANRSYTPAVFGTAVIGPFLREDLRERITKHTYYRSGQTTGMNDWHEACDVIIAFGTPRVNRVGIKNHLLQRGQHAAPSAKFEWESDWWGGLTYDGRRIVVKTSGHINREHRAAYDSVVKGEIVQAVGRARWCCENGVPSIVVSAEEFGYPMINPRILELTESQKAVLDAARAILDEGRANELSERLPIERNGGLSECAAIECHRSACANNHIEGRFDRAVATSEIADAVGLAHRYVYQILCKLEKMGFTKRKGIRGGWFFLTRLPYHSNGWRLLRKCMT